MITHKQILLAISRIIRRKREKNEALKNEQKQPRFALVAVFGEIQKELDKTLGPIAVPEYELNQNLLEMVRSRSVVPAIGGFTLPAIMSNDSKKITNDWKLPITDRG